MGSISIKPSIVAPAAKGDGRGALGGLLSLWWRRHRTRRALGQLAQDARALADLGLTREQVREEAVLPFWR
jgi:uncharacterized protein YjiS (DUF1127 family)